MSSPMAPSAFPRLAFDELNIRRQREVNRAVMLFLMIALVPFLIIKVRRVHGGPVEHFEPAKSASTLAAAADLMSAVEKTRIGNLLR